MIDTQYQALIALIGSNTPDLRGRTLIGAGTPSNTIQSDGTLPNFQGDTFTINNTGGEFIHKLTPPEMPSHIHTVNGGNNGFCLHDRSFKGEDGGEHPFVTNGPDWIKSTDASGGDQYHNNMQPYYTVSYIIYANG